MNGKPCIALALSVLLLLSGCGVSQEEYEAAVDEAYDEGYNSGYEEGSGDVEYSRSEAFDEGVNSGYGSGYDAGKEEGYNSGYISGYMDGYEDGHAEALGFDDPVYITLTGAKYHRSSCSYLDGSKILTSRSAAIDDGYTACSRCNP